MFLLLLTIPAYYVMKGFIVKKTCVMPVITTILFALNIWIGFNLDKSWFRTFLLIYLLYSFAEYLWFKLYRHSMLELPVNSSIRIVTEEVIINYNILRIFIILPVNIYLLIKRLPQIGFKDRIGVDIRAKDGTKINIKI
ncbi:MAG: hypothetical protein R6V47_04905 [Candidatus Delongbacteria bacterium]